MTNFLRILDVAFSLLTIKKLNNMSDELKSLQDSVELLQAKLDRKQEENSQQFELLQRANAALKEVNAGLTDELNANRLDRDQISRINARTVEIMADIESTELDRPDETDANVTPPPPTEPGETTGNGMDPGAEQMSNPQPTIPPPTEPVDSEVVSEPPPTEPLETLPMETLPPPTEPGATEPITEPEATEPGATGPNGEVL